MGCTPWGREESDTTEQLPFQFSLSRTGEGHGSPLQCSCLENPRDGGAWWAAVYGVAQGRTRLKRLSSSSCSRLGVGSLRASACVLMRFVKDAALADSSGVNTQHLVWVMAQVPPCSNNMQGHPIL